MKKIRELKANEIEVRVAQATQYGTTWLLYKTARTDMEILDETFGAENWQNDYKVINGNLQGGIGVKFGDEWIWKWDCGVESNTEKEKGESSDAFKRAGFRWGIGRELYTAPDIQIDTKTVPVKEYNGKYKCYEKLFVKEIEYTDGKITLLVLVNSKNTVVYNYEEMNLKYFMKRLDDVKKIDDIALLYRTAQQHIDGESLITFVALCKSKKETLSKEQTNENN